MRLTRLRLRHFRNLGVQDLEVPPEGVALIGENAHGKSNFLESIYYLETFRSFRGAPDEQLLAFGEDVFRVAATLQPAGRDAVATEVAAAFQRRGKRKKVTVDASEPERMGDALGRVAAVVFSPADVALVSEGPAERRRFLDIVLSLNLSGYLRALQQFRHFLVQRNASLRDECAAAVVHAFDEGLVRTGSIVIKARRDWIRDRGCAFEGYYRAVSGGGGATLGYEASVRLEEAETEGEIADAFRGALLDAAERERRLRTTVVGPHRDELAIRVETRGGDPEGRGVDVRTFGSGGQRRTAALALRLVEAATIRDARGEEPIVLLDDVFAELDEGRSRRVLELMEREETGQVILTAPKDSDVRLRGDALPRWTIRDGRIRA